MYQSVGCEIIEYIAECIDKPLLRKEILGKPYNQDLQYNKKNDNDEVEDMYSIMFEALKKYPEIEAVSSGAIMSSYQKSRVENICKRLNIASLSPLWEKNQKELLEEFVTHNINAIWVRVCSMGLNKNHIGKSLSELKDYLWKLENDFGGNCCGEGGEFETLVLDCPLYKKKIEIIDKEVIVEKDYGSDQTARLFIKKVNLISKN